MTKPNSSLILVMGGAVLFNFLFWQEKMGLNSLLFAVFYLVSLIYLFPDSKKSKGFWLTAGGALLTGIMIVWHNSAAAKFAHLISLMCAAGFAQEPNLRQLLRSLVQYLLGWWQTPRHFFESLNLPDTATNKKKMTFGKALGLSVIPLVVVIVFYLLYYGANDKFAALADRFWEQVGRILSFDISWDHLLFFLMGIFLVGAALWRNQSDMAEEEAAAPDNLLHQRPPKKRYIESLNMMGLKREYQQAFLLLWMLNALLFVVNATDIRYVWFGFDQEALSNLKGYVHEGTYFLIASILLAMAVLFYVFRKNLNFFPLNHRLRWAAAIWLVQNGILAFSVAVRNARYIDYHGLAYKRIGVILFLILVFVGLITLYVKIKTPKTRAWLWRQNGWAFYAVLVLNACVAWDEVITQYNLSGAPKGAVDIRFMIYNVSDKNLYLLEDKLQQLPSIPMYPVMSATDIQNGVARKRELYEEKMGRLTWKSWNKGDLANQRK